MKGISYKICTIKFGIQFIQALKIPHVLQFKQFKCLILYAKIGEKEMSFFINLSPNFVINLELLCDVLISLMKILFSSKCENFNLESWCFHFLIVIGKIKRCCKCNGSKKTICKILILFIIFLLNLLSINVCEVAIYWISITCICNNLPVFRSFM